MRGRFGRRRRALRAGLPAWGSEPWPTLPSGDVGPVDARSRRRRRGRNALQGVALVTAMGAVLGLAAWLLFGRSGMGVVLVAAVLGVLLRPRVPVGWMLRMTGARPLPEAAAPALHAAVRALAHRAGLPRVPLLCFAPTSVPNAFATGTAADGAVVVTAGLLRRLTPRELLGVLAHEISHLRAGDTRVMNLSDVLARITTALAYAGLWITLLGLPLVLLGYARPVLVGLTLTVLPFVSALFQTAFSRSREYEADRAGAELTGDPEGLAAALMALERSGGTLWERLVGPRRGPAGPALLRTHPPTTERVARLRAAPTAPAP